MEFCLFMVVLSIFYLVNCNNSERSQPRVEPCEGQAFARRSFWQDAATSSDIAPFLSALLLLLQWGLHPRGLGTVVGNQGRTAGDGALKQLLPTLPAEIVD